MEKLKKELNLIDIFSIATGSMISSGLFILPGLVFLKIGPAAFLAYFIAGIFVIPSLLSKAELSTAMPKAGGDYFFINRSMGSGFGTLAGISAWFSLSFKSAFALLGIGAFVGLLYPSISVMHIKMIGVFFCLFFGLINILGAKHAGKLQNYIVFSLLAILFVYIFRGLPEVKLDNFQPFMKGNMKMLFASAGLIFISYGGLTKVASVSEEVKNPARNIPLGMILSFVVVTAIYVLVVFITVGVLGSKIILPDGSPSLTPISHGASVFLGNFGLIILSLAALLAFISTGNAGILSASRTPLAMSRDNLLPSVFAKIHHKYKTPYFSILFTMLFMIIVIVFLDLEMLVKTASTMKLLLFTFVNISVIVMRESGIQNYRPKFHSPLYPWLQIFAILIYIFLIIEMGVIPLMIVGFFFATSLIWYWFYGRIRTNRESALLHIIQRIGAKEITSHTLENELKEIIRERDDIQKDRFDRIIEKCKVLDLHEELNKNDLFEIVAVNLAPRLLKKREYLLQKMIEREEESTMVLTENLAIPHIIIEGEKLFDIMLIRSEKGIYFSESAPKVQIVFVIAGTRDERPFHLRSLAAIAQIVQNSNFEKKWFAAETIQAIRDTVLLGERKR